MLWVYLAKIEGNTVILLEMILGQPNPIRYRKCGEGVAEGGNEREIKGQIRAMLHPRAKCMSFRSTQPSLKNNNKMTPTGARPKSSIMPAIQHSSTFQRKSTDKTTEALYYLI